MGGGWKGGWGWGGGWAGGWGGGGVWWAPHVGWGLAAGPAFLGPWGPGQGGMWWSSCRWCGGGGWGGAGWREPWRGDFGRDDHWAGNWHVSGAAT
jgi:hypothetical protein